MGSKKRPCTRFSAFSLLTGSPGRCRLKTSSSASSCDGDVVALQGVAYQPRVLEAGEDLLRPAHPERLQEHGDGQLPLAVDAHGDVALGLDLELEPGPPARHQARRQNLLGLVLGLHDVSAGRTHELRHHDPLGPVDDECTRAGHEREVAHEDVLLPDLAGLLDDKADLHEQRRRVRLVLGHALFHGDRRLLEAALPELHGVRARVILYGGDLRERSLDALVEELLK